MKDGVHNQSNNTHNNSFSIPREIELEIFTRLPIEYLIRFRCVCKQWKSTIENEPFFHSMVNSSILISFSYEDHRYIYSVGLNGGAATHRLTLPGCGFTPCGCSVSKSVNGLVCYYNEFDVYICNPSTNEFKILPRSGNFSGSSTFSFGFVPSTKEYKVLHTNNTIGRRWPGHAIASEIFTLRTESRTGEVFWFDTDSWRNVTDFPIQKIPLRSEGLCINGALHWIGTDETEPRPTAVLVAFDLNSEEFRLITRPEGISTYFDFTKVRGCLALLDYVNSELIEMWVLQDYDNQLWIKESIESPPYHSKVRNPISFGNVYTGEMLLTPNIMSHDYIMVPYHLKKKSVRLIRVSGLLDWLSPCDWKYLDFSISNHAENLSPLVTKSLAIW